MTLSAGRPSLRRRLLLTLLPPLCGILLVLGIYGAWFVHQVVERESDRLLSGSLQAISETLAMEGGYLTLDLPPSALGMLENSDRDNVYYNVSYRGKLVTGYPELSVITENLAANDVRFRDGTFRGAPIRIAYEARLVPQLGSPVIVQVAETIENRTALANRMLAALAAGEVTLLAIIAGLVFWGVDWGLRPLSVLRREVDARLLQPELDFGPLPVSSAPREILPFVSAFNALLSHVEGAVETLQRFTSDASHQLRAPLAVVRTHVELLRRGSGNKDDMHEAIADIHAAVLALQHLTVQLIALAKAERPANENDNSNQFDLVGCARTAARSCAAAALARNMDLSFETACEELPAWGNAIFASEMIANLLDNAIRYGRPGGHIMVRILEEPGVLEIEDDGPGIPPAQRERVFERFYRMPGNLDRDGSGLGLSIVQALSRRMGARVSLETPASGQGLKAVLRFRTASVSPLGMLAPRPVPATEEFRADQTIHVR